MPDANNDITPRYISEKEAEKFLSMTYRELQFCRQEGKLKAIQLKAGGCLRYDINDIIKFMEEKKL